MWRKFKQRAAATLIISVGRKLGRRSRVPGHRGWSETKGNFSVVRELAKCFTPAFRKDEAVEDGVVPHIAMRTELWE